MAHHEGLITLVEEPEKRAGREERTRGKGDEERLVKVLPQLPAPSALFHVVALDPIPWLNSDQKLLLSPS